ncbi:MAG: hypothetical protein ACI9N0_003052 [Ilumatobacter sp.]|jgi:hypothetical protein
MLASPVVRFIIIEHPVGDDQASAPAEGAH